MEGMEIVKWLLIALLGAVAAGSIVGVVWGKHQVKKARGEVRSILSVPQRIVCAGSLLLGLACVLFAVLYNPTPAGELDGMEGGEWGGDQEVFFGGEEGDFMEGGFVEGDFDNPAAYGVMDGDLADWNENPGAEGDYDMDDEVIAPDMGGEAEADEADVEANVSTSGGAAVAVPRAGRSTGGVVRIG